MAQGVKRTTGRTLDHVAHVYDMLSPLMLFGLEERMSRPCLTFLKDDAVRSVLDVGCGTGTLTLEMAHLLAGRFGAEVTGIDAAPRMIDVARRKGARVSNVRFDVGIAEDLPYPDASFDYAVSTFFFHHIDFALKVKALDEMWRVLKKNTMAVLVDVDTPTNAFGSLCAWAGYHLFRQEEIRENIEGKLRLAIARSRFGGFEVLSRHQGYISVLKLVKKQED